MPSNIIEIVLKMVDKASPELAGVSKRFQTIGENLTRAGKTLTMGVTLPLVAAGGLALKAASDYEQAMGAVETVFDDAASTIKAYSETSATSVGLSAAAFSQLSTVTGAFLQNVGYNAGEAAAETITLTERAADMAAVFNTDVTTALAAIQSGLKGEFNPLEQFGVKINAASIEAKALAMGLATTKSELDDNAKAQAALALVMEQTNKLQGTFQDEAGGVAGSMQILKAQLGDVAKELGVVLIPIAIKFLGALTGLIEKFQALSPATKKFIVYGGMIAAAIGPVLLIVGQLITAFGAISGAISTVSAFMSASFIPAVTAAVPALGAFLAAAAPILLVLAALVAAALVLKLAWDSNFLGMKDTILQFVELIKAHFQAFILVLQGDWEGAGKILRDVWNDTWDLVIQRIEKVIPNARELFENMIDSIVSAIRDGASRVLDAAADMAQAALDAIKDILGIDSPSKAMLEVGKNMSIGLAQGITGMTATPVQAMAKTAGALTSAAEGGGGMVNNFYITGGNPQEIADTVIRELKFRMA